jgi:hypothetical protein
MKKLEPKIKSVEEVFSITTSEGGNRCLFVNKEYTDVQQIALADYISDAMGGAFKKWYSKDELVADLRATADAIEKLFPIPLIPNPKKH